MKPELRVETTAHHQIQQLGFDPRDVRHILLSHLDFDHARGLDDFPDATVHMLAAELGSASARHSPLDKLRYRPQQWGTRAHWRAHQSSAGDSWFDFELVRELAELGPDLLMVPLLGHTLGHAGVAIRTGDGWLFYAADAYFFHAEMDVLNRHCTPGLALYQTLMEKDRTARLANQGRLRELKRQEGHQIEIFCAHDVREFERLSGRSHTQPASREAARSTILSFSDRSW